MKRLVFTVTNDLNFDQRMIRICTSLQSAGYDVSLVGVRFKNSGDLRYQNFSQHRIFCFFRKGFHFYLEYNLKLFIHLFFRKLDLICAIDLDTILPCLLLSKIRQKKRVYDAHELFCEMKEVVTRKRIYRFWKQVERLAVPRFAYGYTVNDIIQNMLYKDYHVNYEVIRNIAVFRNVDQQEPEDFIIYQGAVNEGRSFETLIPAFKDVDVPLHIYGDGNFMHQAIQLIQFHKLEKKVILKGKTLPDKLRQITPKALLGITLFENNGLSNYYSLANRFFDYMHAGIPQICVNYPVYKGINEKFEVSILVDDISSDGLSSTINAALRDRAKLAVLRKNCSLAKEVYNWQNEEKKLVNFYNQIFE